LGWERRGTRKEEKTEKGGHDHGERGRKVHYGKAISKRGERG